MSIKKMQLYHFRNFDNTMIDFQDGSVSLLVPITQVKVIYYVRLT